MYFGLNDLESSAIRVDTRVMLGGHDVPLDVMRYNMEEGVKRVIAHLSIFDKISFVDTSMKDSAPIIAYFTKDTASFAILQEDIKWFNENFKQPLYKYFLKLTDNFLQKPDKNFKEIKPENDEDNDRHRSR